VKDLNDPTWSKPPKRLEIAKNQIHIWRTNLDITKERLEKFKGLLSRDELQRARKYKFERDRDWYVSRRSLLRVLLSNYLEVPPDTITFSYNRYGKPFLRDDFSTVQLDFNLSHSGGFALYAFGLETILGIDIERRHYYSDFMKLAERYFSAYEIEELRSLPPQKRSIGFYNCWTRKEAFIKAHGEGLSLALDAFDVSLIPEEPAHLLATRGDLESADKWRLVAFTAFTGFTAALAVKGSICDLVFLDSN
jgi:4'-phosphopantetheinyl transferase